MRLTKLVTRLNGRKENRQAYITPRVHGLTINGMNTLNINKEKRFAINKMFFKK